MTTVHVSMSRDDGASTTAAEGSLYWEPTTRREDGTVVVLPQGFAMSLLAGEATATVAATGLTWCWRVTERVAGGTVRYVSVPDSATTVEYVDLPDVDPTTLVEWSPADPEAAYLAALADLDVAAAVETYLLANPVTAPVDSVNAQTGVVVLDAADVGAVAPADLATVATSGDYNDLSNRPTFKTVSNQTGAPIAADTLVEISGAFGIFVTVRVADNSTADHVAGITTAEIADGATGEIQVTGEVTGLNTSALTAGTPLYLSTSGGWTDTRPTAPAHVIRVGVAGVTHPTAGTIVFTLPSYEVLADNVDGLDAKVTAFAEDGTAALGASLAGTYEPIKGADDNYVTDAEKAALHSHANKTALDNVSGTNTGDQDLSGYLTSATAATTYVAQADLTVTTGASVSGSNTGDQDLSGYATITQTINAQTGTTYTLVAGDAGKLVTCTNAGAITVTLPQDSAATFAMGSRVDFAVLGAGMVTFAADAGSTVNGTPSLVTRAQYSAATAIKRAADTWLVVGDLATP